MMKPRKLAKHEKDIKVTKSNLMINNCNNYSGEGGIDEQCEIHIGHFNSSCRKSDGEFL